MRGLSVFVDESGSDGLSDRHYLLTVVMHDQSDSIASSIERGASGELVPGTFDGFCGLIEDIIQGINKLSDSSDTNSTEDSR